MKKSTNIWNYKDFETANGKLISEIDYINLVIRELNIPISDIDTNISNRPLRKSQKCIF